MKKRLLTGILCMAMIFGYGMSSSVWAGSGAETKDELYYSDVILTENVTMGNSGTEDAKTINVGANAMNICQYGWTADSGQYLYYGAYNGSPVKYRVLDRMDGTGHSQFHDGAATMKTAAGDYLTIDSDRMLFNDKYVSIGGTKNIYTNSNPYSYLKDGKASNGTSLFSTKELAEIADTQLQASNYMYGVAGFTREDCAATSKSFLLSAGESYQLYSGDAGRKKAYLNGTDTYDVGYWHRSGNPDNQGMANGSKGMIYRGQLRWNEPYDNYRGVTAASNLDLKNVLFTSSSDADKTSDLTKISRVSDNTWKATLKDSNKSIDTTGTVTKSGSTVTVPYSYSGEDIDQVSVAITDGDISSSSANVLYYGKLAAASGSKSGTATFTLPSDLPDGYKTYILAEDINDWEWTDYAAIREITVSDTYNVAFDSNGGNYTPEDQSVASGNTASKPSDPTKDGYAFGGWYLDKEMTTAYDFSTAVTKDITLYAKWTASAAADTPESTDSSGTAGTTDTTDPSSSNSTKSTPATRTSAVASGNGGTAKTGDDSSMWMWILLVLTGAGAATGAAAYRRRKDS